MILDAHIHLQDAPGEAPRIIRDAEARGVGQLFCNGSSPSDWEEVRSLASSSTIVKPFFGIHPWYVGEAAGGWEDELARRLEAVKSGVGEIGLDKAKARTKEALDLQLAIFGRQLDIAIRLERPFTVHCVQAWDLLLAELRSRRIERAKIPFIIHWFSGSPETAQELIRLGAFISFSPRLLDETADRNRAAFAAVPAERILLETDYPYMPDVGKGEIPPAKKYFETLQSLYVKAASLKKIGHDEFAAQVWKNGSLFLH